MKDLFIYYQDLHYMLYAMIQELQRAPMDDQNQALLEVLFSLQKDVMRQMEEVSVYAN